MDTRAFLREHLANPTLLVGAVVALSAGMSLGSYLKAGDIFQERAAPQVVIDTAGNRIEAISYMTDARGRIPSYVIGTDSLYQPTELPLVRTAWEEPTPILDEVGDLPTLAPIETPVAEPVAYAPPPSVGGDILAIGAGESAPVG